MHVRDEHLQAGGKSRLKRQFQADVTPKDVPQGETASTTRSLEDIIDG